MTQKVLIVEDDLVSAELMRFYLEGEGCAVTAVNSCARAMEAIESFKPAVLVTDIRLHDGNGSTLAERCKESAGIKVICVTGFSRAQLSDMNIATKSFDTILEKPVDLTELSRIVRAEEA